MGTTGVSLPPSASINVEDRGQDRSRRQDQRARLVRGAELGDPAAADVEQRHGVDAGVAGPGEPGALGQKRERVDHAAVVQDAPLGKPVVPEVYWIWSGSPGATAGSAVWAVPSAAKASISLIRTVSRR